MNFLKQFDCLEKSKSNWSDLFISFREDLLINQLNKELEHVEKWKETLRHERIGLLEDNFLQELERIKGLNH